MCGITGLVAYERDLTRESGLAARMTATLEHRGPDGNGTWTGRHALLGHRRLAVIDPAGGTQPMVAHQDGRPAAVVVFCGEIYNFRELRAQLETHGHRFRTRSDTEVLLHAYLQWPGDFLDRLDGMFALAIWDVRAEELLLARDHLGIKPLCYTQTPDGIVFGSEPKSVLASNLASRRVTAEGLCEILDMVCTPGITPYADIRDVKPGDVIRVSPRGTACTPWWRLQAREHAAGLRQTVSDTRALLEEAVTRQLVADVPVCTFLSGGLDSSAVTAIAARHLQPEPVRAFSVDFTGQPGRFAADAVRGTADTPFARDVAAHTAAAHETIMLDSAEMTSPGVRTAVLHATDVPPAYWGDMWPSLYLLCREVRRRSVTVALSGEVADELWGGYRWFRNPSAVNAGTFPWLTPGSARYFGGSALLSPELLDRLDIPGYRNRRYREALTEVPALPGEPEEDRVRRRVTYLALTRFACELLRRKDRMSMATGLEVRVPYASRKLIEHGYNIPAWMHAHDGREKSMLRAAVADLLPEPVAMRAKNPYPATQDAAYERALRRRLGDVLSDPHAPVIPLLHAGRALKAAGRDVGDVSQPYDRGSVEMALWLNQWLTEYKIDLDL